MAFPNEIMDLVVEEIFGYSSYPGRVLQDGATAYFRLGESYTKPVVFRDKVYGITGTSSPATPPLGFTQMGALGDGNGSIRPDLTGTVFNFSPGIPLGATQQGFEAWVRLHSFTTDGREQYYLSNTSSFGLGVDVPVSSGGTGCFFFETTDGVTQTRLTGSTVVELNRWYYIAAWLDPTGRRIYLGSEGDPSLNLEAQDNDTLWRQSNLGLRIGGRSGFPAWKGWVDEVAFYSDVPLSITNISSHYDALVANSPVKFSTKAQMPLEEGDLFVQFIETSGSGVEYTQDVEEITYGWQSVQVTTRGADAMSVRDLALRIFRRLSSIGNEFVGGTWYVDTAPLQLPFDGGLDELTRIMYRFNIAFLKSPS